MSGHLYRKGDEVEIVRRGVIVEVDPKDPARYGIGRPDGFGADAYFRTDDEKVRHTLVAVADISETAAGEAAIRADERARCVAELRAYSRKRMDEAVPLVSAGKDEGFAAISHAASVDRAAHLLESGELSVPQEVAVHG